MKPRITLITLGVADVGRSRRFYERLGFVASPASVESTTFMQAGGIVLALFGRSALAEDAGLSPEGHGFAGISIAHNVGSEDEVAQVIAEAVAAGATLVKPAQKVFWGGTSGYFADPDGHLWEVAHNPGWPLDENGQLVLPPAP